MTSDGPGGDLTAIGAGVHWTDHESVTAARELLTAFEGRLGRLEELAEWLAGVQGTCPPRDPARVRCVSFAGDHGVVAAWARPARHSADERDPDPEAEPAEATPAAETAAHPTPDMVTLPSGIDLTSVTGVGRRFVDVALDNDQPTLDRIRRGSGRIDVEDALSSDELTRAVALGASIADHEIDSGADLLIATVPGVGALTTAAVLISVLTNAEPVKVMTRGTLATDPQTWMAQTVAVRDARRRGFTHRSDPGALLAAVGGADFVAAAGFVLQAAVRQTGVVLDGLSAVAAALVAYEAAPRAVRWWLAADHSPGPAHELAMTKLGLRPVLDLGLGLTDGTAGALAVPVLRAAARALAGAVPPQ